MLLFKNDLKYSLDGQTIEKHIFKSGEEYSLDCVLNALGKNNLDFFIKQGSIVEKNIEHINNQDPAQPENQDDSQQTFEIMYKITQSIQDKDGNEIEVGTQLTQKALKEKGFTKKKLELLIQEEKVMEVKIVK